MATYKGIKGFSIQNLSADPSNPIEGEMWYNSTSGVWKVEGYVAGAWASGGTMSAARGIFRANVGTQTAALAGGGFGPAAPNVTTATEEYDGSTWTSGGAMGSALYGGLSAGSQTSAISAGGNSSPGGATNTTAESYNGTSWSGETSLPSSRSSGSGAGTSETAAILFCGGAGPSGSTPFFSETLHYDGSAWTAGGSYPTGLRFLGGCGTSTAALGIGGNGTANVNEYDGTSWSSHSTLPTIRYSLGSCGNLTDALVFSGETPTNETNSTILWDGVSWTSQADLSNTAVKYSGSNRAQSTSSLGFKYGGRTDPGAYLSSSEEWTGGTLATKTITAS